MVHDARPALLPEPADGRRAAHAELESDLLRSYARTGSEQADEPLARLTNRLRAGSGRSHFVGIRWRGNWPRGTQTNAIGWLRPLLRGCLGDHDGPPMDDEVPDQHGHHRQDSVHPEVEPV